MMSNALNLTLVFGMGILVLLFLVIKLKIHAFISLLIVSMGVGIAAGMPANKVMDSIQNGMGGTLGFIATVVGLGSIFGKMLEVSGGAERLARTLLEKFGKEKAQWAMTLTGFIISIPVFFDVGFIILVPIVYGLTKETNKSVLFYGIPLLAGLAVTHAFVPPTPGPVSVAQLLNADLGKVILFGIIVGIPAAAVAGPIFAKYISKKINVGVPDYMIIDEDEKLKFEDNNLPSFSLVFSIIFIPIILIVLNSVASIYLPEGDYLKEFLGFIGHPFFSLTLATIISFVFLGISRGFTMDEILEVSTASLAPAGLIILVTGAGGVFKQILIDSGVGELLANSVSNWNINPILLAFAIAIIVRVSVGSATVAMITSAGIMAPILENIPSTEPALVTIAIAAGATALSHVNDSGFWMVNRYFGIDELDTLKSWTIMETLIGIVGLIGALILDIFV